MPALHGAAEICAPADGPPIFSTDVAADSPDRGSVCDRCEVNHRACAVLDAARPSSGDDLRQRGPDWLPQAQQPRREMAPWVIDRRRLGAGRAQRGIRGLPGSRAAGDSRAVYCTPKGPQGNRIAQRLLERRKAQSDRLALGVF